MTRCTASSGLVEIVARTTSSSLSRQFSLVRSLGSVDRRKSERAIATGASQGAIRRLYPHFRKASPLIGCCPQIVMENKRRHLTVRTRRMCARAFENQN